MPTPTRIYQGGETMPAYTPGQGAWAPSSAPAPVASSGSGGGTVFQGGQSMPAYGTSAYNALAGGTTTPVAQPMAPTAPTMPVAPPNAAGAPIQPVAPVAPNIPNAMAQQGLPSGTKDVNALATELGVQNYTGTPTQQSDVLSKFEQANAKLKASGVPITNNAGQSMATVNSAIKDTPQARTDMPPAVTNFTQTNPYFQQSIKDVMEIINPETTRKEIADQMKVVASGKAEAAQIKTDLMNIKRVMGGTEQEISDEITKAGGFSTSSQVRALSIARNSALLKQASQLTDQLSIVQDAIANDTTLLGDMKQQANTLFSQGMQIMNYMQENQRNSFNAASNSIDTLLKMDGGLSSMVGHPDQLSYVDQIKGWPSGTTAGLASQPAKVDHSPAYKEWKDAVSTGYKGTFMQYQDADANRKQKATGVAGFTAAQVNTTVNQIAGAFDNEPIVKNFNILNEGYQFAKNLSNDTKNPADDQGLIYAFAKAMDPGSVVREGEYNTVQRYAQSLVNSYGKSVTQAIAGTGFLSTDARTNLKKTIESKYQASKINYDSVYAQYQQRINDAKSGKGNSLTDYSAAYKNDPPKEIPKADIPNGFYQASDGLFYKK